MKKNLSGGSTAGEDSNIKRGVKKSGMGTDQRTNPSPAQPYRTPTFQAFLDSLKTPHRKVVKLSLDYATRR